MPVYSERLRAALFLAERAHRGQIRKGREVPYVLHPVCVAALLFAAGADEDLVCAGYLHDVCLLYTSPSPRDISGSRMPSSA